MPRKDPERSLPHDPANPRARCDLCGREAAGGKPLTLFSQVVLRPEKRVSLETAGLSSSRSASAFKSHEFVVCSRCRGRKTVFGVAAVLLLAAWIWLAIKSRGPGLPFLGLAVILAFAFASGPFLPVQRLARRVRREEKMAFAADRPGLRFFVKVLTISALPFHQHQASAAKRSFKTCEGCHKEVPLSSKAGDFCPHCGVRWGSETAKCDSCGAKIPGPVRTGDPCPRCGASWGA